MNEEKFNQQVADYLQLGQKQGKWMFLRLDAEHRLVIHNGSPVFLELKGEGGKLTKEQRVFKELALEHGGEYYVIRDLEQVKKVFES